MAKVAAAAALMFFRCTLLVALLVSVEMMRPILGEDTGSSSSSSCIHGIFCYNKPNKPPQQCIDACQSKFGPTIHVSCRTCGGSPLPLCYCG